jgi:hypothetical protein
MLIRDDLSEWPTLCGDEGRSALSDLDRLPTVLAPCLF